MILIYKYKINKNNSNINGKTSEKEMVVVLGNTNDDKQIKCEKKEIQKNNVDIESTVITGNGNIIDELQIEGVDHGNDIVIDHLQGIPTNYNKKNNDVQVDAHVQDNDTNATTDDIIEYSNSAENLDINKTTSN